MGRSRTISEICGDFSRKSQIFPSRRVFCAPAEGPFPLELGTGDRGQKLACWSYRAEKEV